MSGSFHFSFFCHFDQKRKKSAVLFVYFLFKKSAFFLKMSADFFHFLVILTKMKWNKQKLQHWPGMWLLLLTFSGFFCLKMMEIYFLGIHLFLSSAKSWFCSLLIIFHSTIFSYVKSNDVSVKAAKGRQRDHHVIGKRVGAKTSDAFTDAVLDGLCPAVTFISIEPLLTPAAQIGHIWIYFSLLLHLPRGF